MGLDLSFNRMAALDAGLELDILPNSDREDFDEDEDPEYIRWCMGSSEYLRVPYSDWYVCNDGSGDSIIVRANKWGRTYEPLTKWLIEHGIEWDEF